MNRTNLLSAAVLVVLSGLAAPAQQTETAPADPHERRHMEHRFDPERWAKSFDSSERDAWQKPDQVLETLDLKGGERVADVGAGTGYFTVRLARAPSMPTVYAVDIEPKAVEYLQRRADKEGLKNVVAVQASGTAANLPEPVDCILVVNTYHHIADRVAYFQRIGESLRSGGRIAIIDFKKGAPMGPPEEYRFTPAEIQSEMQKAGFTLSERHTFLPNQEFLIFRQAD